MKTCLCLMLAVMTTAGVFQLSVSNATANDLVTFSLQLRNGSIIRVEAEDESFQWKTVAQDGTITNSEFKVSEIKSLKFTESPASDEVARIRGLVSELASDDYRQRHKAESQLLEQGKPFEKVIEQARDHREPEVRYRVNRILEHLGKKKEDNTTRFSIDFDVLELKDGRNLEGDIGDWTLKGIWNEINVGLNRANCHVMLTELPFKTWIESEGAPLASRSITDEFEIYEKLTLEDEKVAVGDIKESYMQSAFDVGDRGEKMVTDRDFDVGHLFTHRGCWLACETHDGIVVISGYRFKRSQSKERSVGNYYVEPVKKKKTSYQGVMRIDFCVPGNGQIPATVKMAGVFTEIVIPKHTIIEAFNASGHVVGLTQSANEKTSFLGFSCNEPIAYVKVSANDYLNVERLNRDFAIDDLSFTTPVAAPDINFTKDGEGHIVVVTRDHQRLLAEKVKFNAAESKLEIVSVTEGIEDFSLPMEQVMWITPPQSRSFDPPAEEGVYVMLSDGSVVHCQFQQKLVATVDPAIELYSDDVIGVWSSAAICRYPQSADFSEGNIIVVRPLNRVAFEQGEFDWDNGGFEYDLKGAVNIQQAMVSDQKESLTDDALKENVGIEPDQPDPGRMVLSDSSMTIWKAEPSTRAIGTGLLRTNDGQEFVLGGKSGFELARTDGEEITLKFGTHEISFEVSSIHTLNLPK